MFNEVRTLLERYRDVRLHRLFSTASNSREDFIEHLLSEIQRHEEQDDIDIIKTLLAEIYKVKFYNKFNDNPQSLGAQRRLDLQFAVSVKKMDLVDLADHYRFKRAFWSKIFRPTGMHFQNVLIRVYHLLRQYIISYYDLRRVLLNKIILTHAELSRDRNQFFNHFFSADIESQWLNYPDQLCFIKRFDRCFFTEQNYYHFVRLINSLNPEETSEFIFDVYEQIASERQYDIASLVDDPVSDHEFKQRLGIIKKEHIATQFSVDQQSRQFVLANQARIDRIRRLPEAFYSSCSDQQLTTEWLTRASRLDDVYWSDQGCQLMLSLPALNDHLVRQMNHLAEDYKYDQAFMFEIISAIGLEELLRRREIIQTVINLNTDSAEESGFASPQQAADIVFLRDCPITLRKFMRVSREVINGYPVANIESDDASFTEEVMADEGDQSDDAFVVVPLGTMVHAGHLDDLTVTHRGFIYGRTPMLQHVSEWGFEPQTREELTIDQLMDFNDENINLMKLNMLINLRRIQLFFIHRINPVLLDNEKIIFLASLYPEYLTERYCTLLEYLPVDLTINVVHIVNEIFFRCNRAPEAFIEHFPVILNNVCGAQKRLNEAKEHIKISSNILADLKYLEIGTKFVRLQQPALLVQLDEKWLHDRSNKIIHFHIDFFDVDYVQYINLLDPNEITIEDIKQLMQSFTQLIAEDRANEENIRSIFVSTADATQSIQYRP